MTVQKMKINIIRWNLALAAIVVVLNGCLKSSEPPVPVPAQTYISIMHLAPTAPSLDVFFDNTKVSNIAFAPGNVTTAYNAVDKGAFSIKFKKSGSDSLVVEIPTAQYDSLNYYTLFIYNMPSDGSAKATRIKDDFTDVIANPGKPYYRFFHASPNTGAVDLYIDNVKIETDRVHADNATLETLNKFMGTTTGFHIIQVKLAGTDTVIATLSNIEFSAGVSYTHYL
ncbi:MAG: DUF4397 domain-containing protein, partial [Chitinophagaceae bacterium]